MSTTTPTTALPRVASERASSRMSPAVAGTINVCVARISEKTHRMTPDTPNTPKPGTTKISMARHPAPSRKSTTSSQPAVPPRNRLQKKSPKQLTAEEMQIMVLTQIARVAKGLLDRGIVKDPRMIDMGMIWGTGFPPDKGGPLMWADLTGLSKRHFGRTFYETR